MNRRAHTDAAPRSKFAFFSNLFRSSSDMAPSKTEMSLQHDESHDVPQRKRWSFNVANAATDFDVRQSLRRYSNRYPPKEQRKLPTLRKRKLTVPIHLFDNPYFTQTDVIVDARYENLRHVGGGRFGVVVSATDSFAKERVAIKKVFSAFDSAHSARHVLREVRLLRYLQHPRIVRLTDIDVPTRYETWDSVYIITPLLETDLRTALTNGKVTTPRAKKRIIAQLLSALAHMHRKCVMHRDVKSLNVLLDSNLNATLCDLGEARFYSGTTGRPHSHIPETRSDETELTVGPRTALQSAPELFLNEQYDASIDLWGIGCITAELLHPTHRHLFDDMNTRKPIKTIVQVLGFPSEHQMKHLEKTSSRWYMSLAKRNAGTGTLRKLLNTEDEVALDFVSSLLRFSPSERMTAEEALRHPFLAEVVEEEMNETGNNMFDFRLTEPREGMSIKLLKELVWDEVVSFHPEVQHFR